MKNKKQDPKAAEIENVVQTTNQDAASNMSNELNAPSHDPSTEVKEIDTPKSAINTKKAAEVVAAGITSTGSGASPSRSRATTFSGGAGNTRGDESATTREDHVYKSGTRAGRQADSITKKIDYINSEIFRTTIKQSKPLSENTPGIGYNGEYLNEHAITQRCSGGAPGDPLFERSIDSIEYDTLYYTLGQSVSQLTNGEHLSFRNWDRSLNNGAGGYSNTLVDIPIDDYRLDELQVTIDLAGNIIGFVPVVTTHGPKGVDERCSRASADTIRRFNNVSELDRAKMKAIASDQSQPGYSALGDGIVDATDQNRFLRLLDSMVGNIVGTSARKLKEAGAHQLNKVNKDGARKTGPMAEMFNGCIDTAAGATFSVGEGQGIYEALYNTTNLLAGGAGLWLAVNDSLPKYTSKGKVLSLPQGPKLALSIYEANKDPLMCDTQLFELMKHNELYSTIDGPYDPLKPIVISDKIQLVHPINPFVGCELTATNTYNTTIYTMYVGDLRNNYLDDIDNYFARGIYRWFEENGSKLAEHLERCFRREGNPWTSGNQTIHIPVVSSATSFSLWDLIVCQSTYYIVDARAKSIQTLTKYMNNHGYPYSNVQNLGSVDVDACDNYSITSIESPINPGIAKPVAALKVLLPEVFWPVAKVNAQSVNNNNGIGTKVVLPHYFVQNQFRYDQVTDAKTMRLVLSDEYATMAYPSTRVGSNYSFMDTIYGMGEEDYKLALDRMTVYPGYEGILNSVSKFMCTRGAGSEPKYAAAAYKYGFSTDGLVVLPYFAYASDSDHKEDALTVGDILATPRELGLMQVAPAGLMTPIRTGINTENLVDVASSYLALSGPGFRLRIYHAVNLTPETNILAHGSMNINNNASLQNVYDVIGCNRWGCVNFANGLALNATTGRVQLSPFTSGSYDPNYGDYDAQTGEYVSSETQDTALHVNTIQRYTFTRIQRLPFIINPFDCNTDALTTATGSLADINSEDIFDFLYMFGFCGFRASDYSELVNQRVKERIAKGMNYTVDPFVVKSLLLK